MRASLILTILTFLPLPSFASWRRGHECPTHIKTTVPGAGLGSPSPKRNETWAEMEQRVANMSIFDTMSSVHEALISCPNITELDLTLEFGGCTELPDRWSFPFNPSGGDRYPPLKSLRLEAYNFDEKLWDEDERRLKVVQSLALLKLPWYKRLLSRMHTRGTWESRYGHWVPAAGENNTNLDFWIDAMDWSQLESLALIPYHDFDNSTSHFKLIPHLHSLERLDFSVGTGDAFLTFVAQLPNNILTHLKRTSRSPSPLLPLLERQGRSMKQLELRVPEDFYAAKYAPSSAYSDAELAKIPELAPGLTHLSINLHRNGTWPLEALEAIASIPSLRSADLWFDIASVCRRQRSQARRDLDPQRNLAWRMQNPGVCVDEDEYQTPFVDVDSSLELFKYMRAKNLDTDGGGALTNVTLWAGDWEVKDRGPWADEGNWLYGRRRRVVCTTVGKGEGEAWCVNQTHTAVCDEG